jgi:hypothetical protein
MTMRGRKSLALIACLLCFLFLTGLALASGSYNINWWGIGGGGGPISGGGYAINSTIGQPVVGASEGGNYRIEAGFWEGALAVEYKIYLSVVLKNYS